MLTTGTKSLAVLDEAGVPRGTVTLDALATLER
jgi:hypothetical protein